MTIEEYLYTYTTEGGDNKAIVIAELHGEYMLKTGIYMPLADFTREALSMWPENNGRSLLYNIVRRTLNGTERKTREQAVTLPGLWQ